MIILFKTGKGKKDMNELDFNKDYRYILRISILPGMHENERIDELVRCCKKYGFDDVALFINAENMNIGHMTKEQCRPYVELALRTKEALNSQGITLSLNPWFKKDNFLR